MVAHRACCLHAGACGIVVVPFAMMQHIARGQPHRHDEQQQPDQRLGMRRAFHVAKLHNKAGRTARAPCPDRPGAYQTVLQDGDGRPLPLR